MSDLDYSRQASIFNPLDSKVSASIIGCGSVGSFTALALGKMGVKIDEIFDADRIEEHNLPNQFYKKKNIGMNKTDALSEILKEFTDIDSLLTNGEATGETRFISSLIVSALDSMNARKEVWKAIKKRDSGFYIDSRMGGMHFTIITIDLSNAKSKKRYEATLIDDSELTQLRCTERTIIFNVLAVASLVCNQVKKINNEEEYPFRIDFNFGDLSIYHSR